MQRDGFWPDCPMRVFKRGEFYYIVRGQHRFEAARRLGSAVQYVILPEAAPEKDGRLTRKWTMEDHAGCYAQQGKNSYYYLTSFAQRHGIPLSSSAALLSGKQVTCRKDVLEGKFEVLSVDIAEAAAVIISALATHVKWARHSHVALALRLMVDLPGFSHKTMIDRINANPGILTLQPNRDGYLKLFETVYNYRSRESDRLQIAALAADRLRKLSIDGRVKAAAARAKNLRASA